MNMFEFGHEINRKPISLIRGGERLAKYKKGMLITASQTSRVRHPAYVAELALLSTFGRHYFEWRTLLVKLQTPNVAALRHDGHRGIFTIAAFNQWVILA